MSRLRVLALVTSGLLLASCSADATSHGDEQSQQGRDATATQSAFDDPTPLLQNCALTKKRVRFLIRDWSRVVDSVGRGDHSTYTAQFVKDMKSVGPRADGCPGTESLKAFEGTAKQIDARASKPRVRYALYRTAARQGNAWLEELNWGSESFSPG